MKRAFLLFFALSIPYLSLNAQVVNIEITTELGSIMAELYPAKAPISVSNFIKYIEAQKFDSASFYRALRMDNQPNNDVKIEVIQGGISYNRTVSSFPPIAHETSKKTGIMHKDGVLSMARVGPGSAKAEFFICIGNQPSLDFGGKRNPDGQGFSTFGKVTKGMDIVKKIQQSEDRNQYLIKRVMIYSIQIIGE